MNSGVYQMIFSLIRVRLWLQHRNVDNIKKRGVGSISKTPIRFRHLAVPVSADRSNPTAKPALVKFPTGDASTSELA